MGVSMKFNAGYDHYTCVHSVDENVAWEWLQQRLSHAADQVIAEPLHIDEDPDGSAERWEESSGLAGAAEAVRRAADNSGGSGSDLKATLYRSGRYRVRQYWPEEVVWWVAVATG